MRWGKFNSHPLKFKVAFFCLFSQEETHLSALFTRNSRRHWGKCSFTQVQAKIPHINWRNVFCFFFSFPTAMFVLYFRCRTLSGSPRPKSFKKIHFIKNMRQHDMHNGRYEVKQSRPPVKAEFSLNDGRLPQSMKCSLVFILTLQARSIHSMVLWLLNKQNWKSHLVVHLCNPMNFLFF